MPVSVGIDLGTTYSAVAIINPQTNLPEIVPNREGGKITPSVIQFVNGMPVFGTEAADAYKAGDTGCAATFKRMMGSRDKDGNIEHCAIIGGTPYTAEELSSLLLRHLKESAEAVMHVSIKDAVITVPAYFCSAQKEATKLAAEKAGLKVKQLIDEPSAAALAYGINNWRENANIFVYDLGGGTFDVTLVRMGENGALTAFATNGSHELGGKDWDEKLTELLHMKFSDETGIDTGGDAKTAAIIRGLAEDIKKQLSQMETVTARTVLPDYGQAEITVSKEDFNRATSGLIEQTGDLCRAILQDTKLSVYDITDVLLVGGSTRMPQVKQYLTDMFNKKPISHVNPDEAVALGAAIQATKSESTYATLSVAIKKDGTKVASALGTIGTLSKDVKPKKSINIGTIGIRQSIAHAMGVITVNAEGTRYINEVIIPANHEYPVKVARRFAFGTSPRKANELKVYVLQGDKEHPLYCEIHPEMYVFEGIRHIKEQLGRTEIRIQYSYDQSGIIHVQARQENDDCDLPYHRLRVTEEDRAKFDLPPVLDEEEIVIDEPLSIVLAVDVSGSMSGGPLDDAQAAMRDNFVRKLDLSGTRVGIVAVSDKTEIVCGLTDDESSLIGAINQISCGQTGYGNKADPFETIETLLSREDGKRFAIVLADGVWEYQAAAVSKAKDCNKIGIETVGVGFGGADKQFLKDISSIEANAVYVSSSSELSRTFGGFAQSLSESGASKGKGGKQGGEFDTEIW